jgi:hypothetical protein
MPSFPLHVSPYSPQNLPISADLPEPPFSNLGAWAERASRSLKKLLLDPILAPFGFRPQAQLDPCLRPFSDPDFGSKSAIDPTRGIFRFKTGFGLPPHCSLRGNLFGYSGVELKIAPQRRTPGHGLVATFELGTLVFWLGKTPQGLSFGASGSW